LSLDSENVLNYSVRILVVFVVSVLFSSCASNVPPSGGPEDKEPPSVLRTVPENKELNFKSNLVEIEFSEYVNRSSVLQNIVIQPLTRQEYSWSGTSLKIHFVELLKDSTTYSISIQNDFTDLQQNKPLSPISIAFSTGPCIDSAKIYGKIIGTVPDGVQIFAYKLSIEDTCNPQTTNPNYSTRLSSDGSFSLESISDGKYRLFAIKDELSNNLFDIGQDMFSIAPKDVDAKHYVSDSIQFKICQSDYFQRADITDVKSNSLQELQIQFTKEVVMKSISILSFEVLDSLNSTIIPVQSILKSKGNQKEITLILSTPLDAKKKYSFDLQNIDSSLLDINLFPVQSSTSKFYFLPRNTEYLKKNALILISKTDSIQNISTNDSLEVIVSKPISNSGTITYSLNSGKKFSLLTESNNRNFFSIPFSSFSNDSWNSITVEIQDSEQFLDTTIVIRVRTQDIRNFGKIKGTILNNFNKSQVILTLKSNKRNGKEYSIITSENEFLFENIEEGSYSLEIVEDSDKNGEYSCGNLNPFQHCEKVSMFPTIFEVKARWSIDKVSITIPK